MNYINFLKELKTLKLKVLAGLATEEDVRKIEKKFKKIINSNPTQYL